MNTLATLLEGETLVSDLVGRRGLVLPAGTELTASVMAGIDTADLRRCEINPRSKKKLEEAFAKLNSDKTYQNLMKKIGENTEFVSGPEYEKVRAEQMVEYKKLVEKLKK